MPQLLKTTDTANTQVWEQENCAAQQAQDCRGHTEPGAGATQWDGSRAPKPCSPPSANTPTWLWAALEHQHTKPAQNTTQNCPKSAFCTKLLPRSEFWLATRWTTCQNGLKNAEVERSESQFLNTSEVLKMSHFWSIFSSSLTFWLFGWDSLFSARQDFRKNTTRGLLFLGLPLRAGGFQMFLLLLDGSGRGFCTNQPQTSPQKCWFGVTLISTKSPLEASASITAHQCNNAIPKNPTWLFPGKNPHGFSQQTTQSKPSTITRAGATPHQQIDWLQLRNHNKICLNCPEVPFKTENRIVRAQSEPY